MLENRIKSYENIIFKYNKNEINSNNVEIIDVNDNTVQNNAEIVNATEQIDIVRDFKGNFVTILSEFIYLCSTTIFTAIILYFLIKMFEYIDSGDI